MRPLRDTRLLAAVVVGAVLVLLATLTPLPGPGQVRDWALTAGPWFPVWFFLAYALIIVAPIPRTLFTLTAGLLFGPITGVSVAVAASATGAAIAFVGVRRFGRAAVGHRLTHPLATAVDRRLAQRGWLAVGSLRLIGAVPFSIVNYCSAVSSIRFLPFFAATVVGLIPGTVGVVVLGDALTGEVEPGLLALSFSCAAIGLLGLVLDARLGVDPMSDRPAIPAPETPATLR
ncbi:TVP38/TMEM64 family protein [Skermania piniformis]|uniref:TVP38/TMEM64 family membrane protein n=1 Tax=Skermania pinensis TaxID=39122 RepID=A0ABX8S3I3_9ACTN|nr:TVP38/TMEM64 family protein [Skermania piniformis]QXQ12359.1 TVP38/TMEM64 family protein [Skermania piniformis]